MFQSRRWSMLSLFVAVMLLACLVSVGSVAGTTFPSGEEIADAKAGDLILRAGTYEIGGKSYRADYGTLVVPENRNKADSRLIQLPIIRIHATGDNPVEPVFLLVGGPGAPNVFSAEALASMKLNDFPYAWLLKHHDFVMVGYRAVDGSVSLNLPEVVEALQVEKNPLSSENLEKLGKAYYAAFQRFTKEGVDIDGYTMVEVIDDMEAARKELGYERINPYSLSYGTRVAYIYSLRYPESIHRTLMVSVNPPGHFVWEPQMVDAQLRYYAGLWEKDAVAASKSPDIIKTMQNVLKTLPQEWQGFRIDPDKVQMMTFMQLMNRGSAAQVFDAYVAAEKGNYSGLAYLSVAYDQMIPSSSNWGERASKAVSADYDPKRDYEAEMDPAGSIIGSPVSKQDWGSFQKGGWPIKPIAEEYRKLQYSDVETLLINGSIDFATPAESAKELLPYLPNGKLVILAEMGHVSDVENIQPEAFQHLVERFYLEGIVDDSKFTYQPMNFTPSQTFQDIAKQFVEQAAQSAAAPASAERGNVYQDPEGRFTIPLVGEWTQIETDGTYALFELTGRPLKMHIVTVESDDLETSVDAALRQVGIDPAALVVTLLAGWEKWSLFYYSMGDGQGVTVLAQVKDGTSYLIIATGDEALTANPPDNVMQTVGGFTFAGEEAVLPSTVEGFEAYINSFVGETTPSLSMVIALGKDVIYAKGFGMADGPKGMRATADTVYQWGSVTKIATAAAIMQLREQGLVDLDAPVFQYLDYFPTEYPITVRHLLSHSSGLPEPPEFEWVNVRLNGTPLPDPDLVDRTYYEEVTDLMFEPGSDSAYVNPDYVTLGQIVAKVSGKPYIQYIQENILTPLGMKTTDFTYKSDTMIRDAASCAVLATEAEAMIATLDEVRGLGDGADFFGETDDQYAWMNPYNPMAGAGGLIGPATEAIRFAQMLLNGGELDGIQILSPQSVALMREVQLSISGAPLAFGLGWHVVDDTEYPYIEHDGGGPGIAARMRLYPNEGFAIVMMSNGTGFDRNEVTDAAANVVLSILGLEKKEPDIEGPDTGQALQGLLDQQVQEQGILGMAMAVQLEDGALIGKASGYSDPSGETPYSVDTRTFIGSLTKTFTAVVVMQLVEERKLSLDDTIKAWFPDQPNADKITVRMLLSHTSGINNYLNSPEVGEKASEEWAPMDLVAEANKLGPVAEPGGSDGFYSNTNFILLGLIIEKVTDNSWSEEVKSRIIESLGLRNTAYVDEEGTLVGVSGGYVKTEDGYQNLLGAYHPSVGWSAGAITSTVSDLITYASALFKGDLFISRETLEEMLQPLASQDFGGGQLADLGLGLMRIQTQGMTIWGHPGDIPGYAAFMGYDPDTGTTLAATVNTLGGNVIMPAISALQYVKQTQQGEQVPAEPALAQAGNVYKDPAGRFTIPLVGDWTQIETDGTYAQFALAAPPMDMYLVTAKSSDLEAGIDAALRKLDIDRGALILKDTGRFGNWTIFYYSVGDGKGLTVLAQVKDEITYCLIGTGDETITMNPPAQVVNTAGGFTLTGEEVILPSTVEEFEAYINSFVGDKPPALSIAIALGGDVIYSKGFGLADGPKGMAATPDTVYQWGSMSKMVTVTAIMQLREQGLVDLDAPVSQYLDYFPTEYPITVRQVVSHSSGLPEPTDYIPLNLRLEGQPLPDPDLWTRRYLDELTSFIFEPGSASAYSSPNSVILGQIVAEVSSKSYMEYARENILIPLGMKNTDFTYSSQAMISKAAAGAFPAADVEAMVAMMDEIRGRGDGADFIREVDGDLAWMNRFSVFAPAGGGLIGPVTEVIRFIGMHLNGGELEGVRILSPESVALMQEMGLSSKGTPLGFGLGWEVIDDAEYPYVEHAGGGYGIQDLMRLYPNEGFAIVIMSNLQGYDHERVVDAAANVIFSMLGLEKTEEMVSTPPITDAEGKVIPGSIASLEEITLGGIQQWILIRGKDTTKPVLLWLHGGPGMTQMAFVGLFQTPELEANFVVVQWDQRGAGKSFSQDLTAEDMIVEKFVSDTLQLTNMLRERFNQEKIFLFGHSWGSALGFLTLMEDSEPYYAFIAAAERVDWNRSQTMGYDWVLEQARKDNNTEVIQVLESVQPFDPTNVEHIGGKNQFLELYRGGDLYTEGLWDKALAYAMGGMSPEYTSADIENYVPAMTFSQQTILPQAIDYNLFRDFPASSIPVHFFAGGHDHQTPGELTEEYYNFLEAPVKSFTWFENSGHTMIWDEVDKTTEELIEIANETLNP
ncbi:hypothetical protein CEE34_04685 [Candidatus Aerophobetes bacterium Ae_b3a]|nr:MAG: hypothetical protein CEE34_04685 [Candidatus Aerophobetes bacterium Ae_b3a]